MACPDGGWRVEQEGAQKVKENAVPLGDDVAEAIQRQAHVAIAVVQPVAQKAEEAVDELKEQAKREAPEIGDRVSRQLNAHSQVDQAMIDCPVRHISR